MAQRDFIPMPDDCKIQILCSEPSETPSSLHLTSNMPSESEKWSRRLEIGGMILFPLSVSTLLLLFAGQYAALYTMASFQALLIGFKVYCFWRRWSDGRQQKS
ncbi:hypothetical protein N7519_006357 [Penicillium mononematosum]|uniref:uncharacterized protein n=1 Tax=Penicillium mononematosum TaxID=268346 RepID=UPI0025495B2A|nr:uncharacterized protein N7519_006357 [Penicillium mononematosum]KAJ6185056.1 hypothetical protein N7519_006357 [Penicillium mononematosum]